MSRLRRDRGRGQQVRIGGPDESLTGFAGLAAVDELVHRLGVVPALDAGIGVFKQRDRGLSAGQLLVGIATAQLTGQRWLSGLDALRADAGSELCTRAPIAASTTARSLAQRFGDDQLAGIDAGLKATYERWLALAPATLRASLVLRAPTIDLDCTDVEVFSDRKEGVGWNYAGVRCGRVHVASWANAELPLAAELLAGNDDVRPRAAQLLQRALAVLPGQVCGQPRVRADAGYFDANLAHAAVDAGCDFAIAAKRNEAAWRAYRAIDDHVWQPARDMPDTQVAACDYAPAGWPEGTYTIVRRVRVNADRISGDARSRRRRTLDKQQLALIEAGHLDHGWAVSFIVTNIPANDVDIPGIEAWFRNRTSIEERFREAKHGAGLIHLPSADARVNTVWMWAALLAGAINVMLQSVTGLTGLTRHHSRVRIDTLRAKLLNLPGRIIHHARRLTLRLPPGHRALPNALKRLRQLPAPT